jgi:hypothetical protein
VPDFSRVIDLAYHRILGRPADPAGLENYNRLMNAGLTEAEMREALLRSGEYSDKNPDRPVARSTAGRRTKKRAKKTAGVRGKSSR